MSVHYHFTATLDGNIDNTWFAWGFPRNWFVNWSIRPSAGQAGNILLRSVETSIGSNGTITYWLSISKTKANQRAITFDGFYQWEEF